MSLLGVIETRRLSNRFSNIFQCLYRSGSQNYPASPIPNIPARITLAYATAKPGFQTPPRNMPHAGVHKNAIYS
jgi:hypothetical protein